MHRRFTKILRFCLLCLFVAGVIVQPQSSAYALTTLTVTPLTWNVIGLDSNNVSVGPNHFPIGARVCNSGGEAATNVTAAYIWDSSDPYIALRPGTLSSINLGTLNAGGCADAYFEVEVTRNSSAYDHMRDYHISVTAGNVSGTISTPTPRELYVEHLISQSRNTVSDMLYGTSTSSLVSVPNGGTMTLMVGNTYFIRLVGSTATQGYEQIESFINFPNTIFQILSVDTTYSAESSSTLNPPYDSLYGDACLWENDPDSPNYRACLSTGKAGGNISVTYEVKILQVPSAPLVNPEPLSTLIYDFSGSSFHYNADYGVSTRYANIVNASISKSFSPKTINPGGTSTLTFTINNPGTAAMSDVNFTDDLPAGMTLANSSVTYSGCGAALPATVSDPMSFSNITVAGLATCTIAVTVTAASDGTYNNTSGNLFIDTISTGSTASDALVVSSQPASPSSCTTRSTLATWTLENYTASATINSGPFSASSLPGTGVTAGAGTVVAAAGSTAAIANTTTYPDAPPNDWGNNVEPSTTGNNGNSWGINTGWPTANPANPVIATTSYFQFRIDGASNYGGIGITADYNLRGNWSNSGNWYVLFSTDGTTWSNPTGGTGVWDKANAWQIDGITTNTTTTSPTVYFRVYAAGAQNDTATMYLDSIDITGCPSPTMPTLSKNFSPISIGTGATSTLTFTLNNPNTTTSLTGVSFNDVLPAGLTVASASTTACTTGILTTTAPRTISLSGGSINASDTCTIDVIVTGATAGSYTNVSSSISSAETGPNTTATGYGTSSITVVNPPVIAKSFNANPIFTGNTTALDFDIVNPNTSTALTGVTFTDVLPVGLSVADGSFSVCSGTNNLTTDAATRTITLSNTTTIDAGDTCSFSVTVTGSTAGSYTNTTGSISSTNGGTGNMATANVLVKTPAPAINLLKQVGSTSTGPWTSFLTATIGSNVYYRFTVENTGDVSLSNVSVDDPTVSTAGCSWARGDSATPVTSPFSLPVADASNNQIATCVLGPISVVPGLHTNTATASGTSGSTVTKSSSATYGTPAITIAKSVTETSFNAAGDVLNYSYLVTNSGDAPLMGPVTVADDRTTVSCPAVTATGDNDAWFDVGESLTCTASYTVLAADVNAGVVTNTASATVSGVTSNNDSETVYGSADLSITKDDGVASVNAGGTTTYTIRVTNNGPSGVTGAILSDAAVLGLTKTAVACSTTPGACVTAPDVTQVESGSFALPALANGQFYEITVTATVDATSGDVTNTATVASPAGGNDPDLTNNTASDTDTVTPAADLTVTKTNNTTNGWVTTGTTFQWTLTIKNSAAAGPATFEAGDTILSDTLPANANYGLIIMGGGIFGPTDCVINSGILTCTANGASVIIPPDGEITVSFDVTPTGTANLVNTAAVVDPDNQVPESDELNNTGSNTVYVFDAEPSKLLVTTSEPSTSGQRVMIGEMVRYRIAARIPEGDFANFQLVDNIPNGLQFVNDGTARFALVSNGAGVTSSTLTCTNDTGNAYDLISLPSANVDCALTGAISGGAGNGVAVTFSLGNLSNADTDLDAEYAVVEFNALALNVTSAVNPTINQGSNNQTGDNVINNRQNDVTLRVNNTTVGDNSANVTVNIAEPAITNVSKSVSVGSYLPGSAITYTLTFSNTTLGNTNAATAFDIVLTDALDANLTPGTINVSSTQTDPCFGGTPFTTDDGTSGQNVLISISCLDPGRSVTVTIDAAINAGTAGSTNISNTANVTYSSLPGAQGNCATAPFTCTSVGGSGSGTGERNGSGGAGVDSLVLNNYADSATVAFAVSNPSLNVVKEVSTDNAAWNDVSVTVNVGDTVYYRVRVANTGNVTLTGLTVEDGMAACTLVRGTDLTGNNDNSFEAGEEWAYTCSVAAVTGTNNNTATAVSNETPQDSDTASYTANDIAAPALNVVKEVSTDNSTWNDVSVAVNVGATVYYRVRVANTGNITLTGLTVDDGMAACTLIRGTDITGDNDSDFEVGEEWAYTCSVTAVAGTNNNTATADSNETPQDSDTASYTANTPALTLDKILQSNTDEDGSGTVSLGDTLIYFVTVTNTGNSDLTNMVISDSLITPNSFTCGLLPQSNFCVLRGTYVVTQADVDAGQIVNTGSVTDDDVCPAAGAASCQDSVTVLVPRGPDLLIAKTFDSNADEDTSGNVSLGDTLTYSVTVTNTGNTTLTNVVVNDTLVTPNTITCASVAPGNTCVLTGTYVVTQTNVDNGQIVNTGSVTDDDVCTTACTDAHTEPVPQSPAITLAKTGMLNDDDGTPGLSGGDSISYAFTVTNNGNVTLANITLADTVGGVTITGGPIASLAPGASDNTSFTGTYILTQADIDAGSFTNTATVTGTPPSGPNVSDPDNDIQTLNGVPALTIVKTSDATGTNTAGDTITYTYDVENTGNVSLANVTVSDAHIGLSTITCTPAQGSTLSPGGTMSCTATYTVAQADVDAGQIDNTGVVTGTPPTGPDVTDNDPLTEPVTQNPSLTLVKSETSIGPYTLNDTITYSVVATNTGNTTLTTVVVSDPNLTPNSVTCASVAPLGTCVLNGTYTVAQADLDAGSFTNTGSVTDDDVCPAAGPFTCEDNVTVSFTKTPDLTITKNETSAGPYVLNDTITYGIVVTNTGNVTLTNVVVSDPKLTPNSNTCTSLAPLGTCVLNGSYTVTQADVDSGSLTNTASVTDNDVCPAAGAATCEDTVTVTFTPTPALTLAKSEISTGPYAAGDSINYGVVVTNTGNTTLTNVVVSDPNLTPTSNTCASVLPLGTCTLTGIYTVQQTDVDAGSFTNTGSVTDDDVCPAAGAAVCEDTVIVSFPQNPDLTIEKSEISTGPYAPGDTITYDVVVTNTGNMTLTTVVVSDPDLTPNSTTCASLAPLGTCTLTGTYTLQQSDVDAGSFSNTGSVTDDDVCPAAGAVTCEDTVIVVFPQNPDLTITKSITSTGPYSVGNTISYDVTVTNTGNTTLTNIVVSDADLTPNSTTCASLAPLGTCTLTGIYTVQPADVLAGSFTNTASVTDDDVCPAAGAATCQDSVTVPIMATLVVDPAISKAGNPLQASVGETITFTLVVTNEGNTPAPNVVITDVLPSIFDVTAVNVTGAAPGTLVNVTPPIGTGTAPYTVVVTLGGDLGVTDVVTIQIVTTVNAMGNPPITNSATLTTSALTDVIANNSDSVTITIRNSINTTPTTSILPATGFAPNVVTDLSNVPQQAYAATGNLTIEIPSLNVKIPVVGIPKKDGSWNVAWLGNQAGWLEGTAFPSWSGNSVLTSHVYLSNGLPGPFVNLGKLKYGDKIVIHAYGQKYTFEVRENKVVEPTDQTVMKHEEKSWLTLVTCKEYDPATNTYRKRVAVRAVLVSVAWE